MKKLFLFCCISIAVSASAFASIDTVFIFSNAMHRNVKAVVITPSNYKEKDKRFPVIYLLHGAYGNATNWANKVPSLQRQVNEGQFIIVCPDGSSNSWYFDSPVDSTYRFETHVGIEVPKYIDSHYKTIADRKHRAITGLSMGGHGALFLAFRHSETFGACGSMSGALDVSLIKKGYDMDKRLGDTLTNLKYYQDWSVLKVIEKYPKDSLAITMDCGLQDFIYGMSKATHDKMVQLNIPHDYTERPGKHDWNYWTNAVGYQLLFFRDYFAKKD